eukprot:scaffold131660_cov27-Prasinocladus_malaysianus.AAC.2
MHGGVHSKISNRTQTFAARVGRERRLGVRERVVFRPFSGTLTLMPLFYMLLISSSQQHLNGIKSRRYPRLIHSFIGALVNRLSVNSRVGPHRAKAPLCNISSYQRMLLSLHERYTHTSLKKPLEKLTALGKRIKR